jgi:hypothetical protein
MRTLRAHYSNQRGMTLVFVGLGMMAFLSATMLAIDVGMFMVARSQAQNSADAGALAGAVALVFDDFNDRTAGGPAVQSALGTSRANQVMSYDVSVASGDVTFPVLERVRVQVHRTAARGNPVLTLIAPIFGVDDVDINATATAEAVPANAATCIKPWAVPDKWNEVHTPPWDENNDEFNAFYDTGPQRGDPLPNPDIYVGADQPGYTGFQQSPQGSDYGRQILLKPGNPNQAISSSQFFPIAMPGGTGADWYEENIPGCWPGVAAIGDLIPVEPGNMTGPTTAGTDLLIARDPGAFWDSANGEVVSAYKPSPRIVVIPVFDPLVYDESRRHGRMDIEVANLVGFFIEDMVGNSVLGRIVPMTGLIRTGGPGGGVPAGSFLRAIRLVE